MSTFELSGGPSLFGTSQRSKSISGQIFGSPCIPGVMSGSTSMSNGFYGMSTANFIQSVANQVKQDLSVELDHKEFKIYIKLKPVKVITG